jgi:hypothetical protein
VASARGVTGVRAHEVLGLLADAILGRLDPRVRDAF